MTKIGSELQTPIHLIESKDYGSAGIDADSVNMGLVMGLSALLSFGAITGNSILLAYAGATAGAKTTALPFRYRLAAGDFKAASADILGAPTDVTAAGLTLTAATYDHRLVAVDIDSVEMPDGKPWLTLSIDATATVLLLSGIAVPRRRYEGRTPPTVI